jgi:hypothetical protein
MIYTDETWENYVKKVEESFKIKRYPHFDPYFNFLEDKNKLKELLKNTNGKGVANHSFLPFVKILIKTPRYRYHESKECMRLETKVRPIAFASHFDSYIYGYYAYALNEIYQGFIVKSGFDNCVLAYRNDLCGKCNIQFAKEVFDIIKTKGECSAIALDIKGYFDSIDHNILKQKWCQILGVKQLPIDQYKIFQSLTKYSYINKNSVLKHFKINVKYRKEHKEKWQSLLDLIPDKLAGSSFKQKFDLLRKNRLITQNKPRKGSPIIKGIPQGSSLSALLSNIYLVDFDKHLFELGKKMNFVYRRYCDDILIICPNEHTNSLIKLVSNLIQSDYKLIIQDQKTEVIDFKPNLKGKIRSFKRVLNKETGVYNESPNQEKFYRNLQYLGFEFNGQSVYIRASSLSRYFRKMKARIVKTIIMSYGKNSKSNKIFKQQIYHRYSHLGKHNFLNYAFKASKNIYRNAKGIAHEGFNSPSIKRQLSAHFRIIKQEIAKTSQQRSIELRSTEIRK